VISRSRQRPVGHLGRGAGSTDTRRDRRKNETPGKRPAKGVSLTGFNALLRSRCGRTRSSEQTSDPPSPAKEIHSLSGGMHSLPDDDRRIYDLPRKVGGAGMGVVCSCSPTVASDREVAIKMILRGRLASDSGNMQRFLPRRPRRGGVARHPGIVPSMRSGQSRDGPFLQHEDDAKEKRSHKRCCRMVPMKRPGRPCE